MHARGAERNRVVRHSRIILPLMSMQEREEHEREKKREEREEREREEREERERAAELMLKNTQRRNAIKAR